MLSSLWGVIATEQYFSLHGDVGVHQRTGDFGAGERRLTIQWLDLALDILCEGLTFSAAFSAKVTIFGSHPSPSTTTSRNLSF